MSSENEQEGEQQLGEVRVRSEPCKPTTSACVRPAHFVRRKKDNIRTAVVPIRLTEDERKSLAEVAKVRGLSLSCFVRAVVTSRKLPSVPAPEINRLAYQELARIGNNLNQLVRAVNSGLVKFLDRDILDQLAEQVRTIGMKLLGVR